MCHQVETWLLLASPHLHLMCDPMLSVLTVMWLSFHMSLDLKISSRKQLSRICNYLICKAKLEELMKIKKAEEKFENNFSTL